MGRSFRTPPFPLDGIGRLNRLNISRMRGDILRISRAFLLIIHYRKRILKLLAAVRQRRAKTLIQNSRETT